MLNNSPPQIWSLSSLLFSSSSLFSTVVFLIFLIVAVVLVTAGAYLLIRYSVRKELERRNDKLRESVKKANSS